MQKPKREKPGPPNTGKTMLLSLTAAILTIPTACKKTEITNQTYIENPAEDVFEPKKLIFQGKKLTEKTGSREKTFTWKTSGGKILVLGEDSSLEATLIKLKTGELFWIEKNTCYTPSKN